MTKPGTTQKLNQGKNQANKSANQPIKDSFTKPIRSMGRRGQGNCTS
jgi:hypothetical protein